jgi:hypothetical protein
MDRSRQIATSGGSFLIRRFIGSEMTSVFDDLATLRIRVFRDFPYLYEGDFEYEKKYLKRYSGSSRGFLTTLYNGEQMIGAATALPLEDEEDFVKRPFQDQAYRISKIFYFGESVLLPEYRGKGLGHVFFDERERFALSDPQFDRTTFCAVVRPLEHALRPSSYNPLDKFWTKRGYEIKSDLQTEFSWADIGEKNKSLKTMQYWMREWKK